MKWILWLVMILVLPNAYLYAASKDSHMYDESVQADESKIRIPEHYEEYKTEHFHFFYAEGGKRIANDIITNAEPMRKRMVSEIGIDPEGITRVFIARNFDDFHKLQPGGPPLPQWVAGVAYPYANLILLRQAGSQGQPINLLQTFQHELSHIVLRRVVQDRKALPKWFVEGLAQYQAREMDLERGLRLAKALVSGRLIPLGDLIYRFPRHTMDIHLAYDESFAFVNFLIGEFGIETFQKFIKKLGKGEDFVDAMEDSYNLTLVDLEQKWISDLKMGYNWIPLLTSGGTIWTLASILIIIGYLKRRKDKKARMAKWEAEEAEAERLSLLARQAAEKKEKDDRNYLH